MLRARRQNKTLQGLLTFPDDVHLILLKSRFDVCMECQVTVLSKRNSKNVFAKSIDFQKKKKISSPLGFEPTTS